MIQNGGYFLRLANFQIFFWGAWNSWYFLGVNRRCWVRAYLWRKNESTPWVYMLMHVSIKSVLICLLVCCLYMYMYVYPSACAWMNIHVPAWTCVCMRACMYVCVYVHMYWSHVQMLYSGRRALTPPPPPRDKKNPSSSHGSAWLSIHPSIHPLKIVKWSHVWTKCQLMHTFNHLNIIGIIMLITGNNLNESQMCENQCL